MLVRLAIVSFVLLLLLYVNLLISAGPNPPAPDTSHRCIGGSDMELWADEEPRERLQEMSCEFRNLYLLEPDQFVYAAEHRPADFDALRRLFWARGMRLQFRNRVVGGQLLTTGVALVFGSCRPRDWPNGANTPGHDLDFVMHAWADMHAWGMDHHTQVYVHTRDHCPELQFKWWAVLAHRVQRREHLYNQETRVRFARLLVTTEKPEAPMKPLPTADTRAFVEHALQALQVSTPTAGCRIGVRAKQRRHRFLNHRQLVQSLRNKCQVIELDHLHNASAREEVSQLRSLQYYLTPGGGGSLSGIFLQPSSHMVLGKICWPTTRPEGGLKSITSEPARAASFECRRSDNLLWDSVNWLDVQYVGPRSVQALRMDGEWKEGRQTHNAFSYSYNVSLSLLNQAIPFRKMRAKTILNVGGYMKTGLEDVARGLSRGFKSVHWQRERLLLKSRPAVDPFLNCESRAKFIPSVARWVCPAGVCRSEKQINFWHDLNWEGPESNLLLVTPTVSFAEMEACFRPHILHFFALQHPALWSQKYDWKLFQEQPLLEVAFASLRSIQTVRMLLETQPVELDRLYLVPTAHDMGSPMGSTWQECLQQPQCRKCLVIAQESLGLLGVNMLNPRQPLKSSNRIRAFGLSNYLSIFKETELKLQTQCKLH